MLLLCGAVSAQVDRSKMPEPGPAPVSYTHLTLPTIYSV